MYTSDKPLRRPNRPLDNRLYTISSLTWVEHGTYIFFFNNLALLMF